MAQTMPGYLCFEQAYHQRTSTPWLAALTKGLKGIIDLLEETATALSWTRTWTMATSFARLWAVGKTSGSTTPHRLNVVWCSLAQTCSVASPRHVPLHPQRILCSINVRVVTVVIGFWPQTAVWQEGTNLSSCQDNATMLCLRAWQFKKALHLHPTIR